MRSFQRGTVAATLLAITASTIAVATPAIADVDPIYDATLTVQDAHVRCLDWPVLEDGDWVLGEQAGPTSGDFVFKTTVASIDDNYDIGDYRVILTYGNPATDGVGYSVGGSGAGPHNDGVENEDGSVTSSWTLGVGDGTESAPVTSVGIELIGYTAADGWVLVHTGSIPVVNECIPPTQQVGGPEWLSLTEGGTPVAGRDAYLDAGQRLSVVATRWGTLAGRWICDCTLNLDVTLKIDGEVAYEGGWPSLWYLHMPSDSAGKTAVVTVTATPDGNGPFDSYWTPVTVTSDPVVIGAAPALTGNLHVFSADPGWNVGWGSQVLCSPPDPDGGISAVGEPLARQVREERTGGRLHAHARPVLRHRKHGPKRRDLVRRRRPRDRRRQPPHGHRRHVRGHHHRQAELGPPRLLHRGDHGHRGLPRVLHPAHDPRGAYCHGNAQGGLPAFG
ncbi:MAG: hypothetical protein NVV57_00465 [Demequina sp.]|nr:hypothetical protein [Demequina sp.]